MYFSFLSMSSSLTIEGKKYVTAVLAGKQFGYTKDYFLMLAKQGKIDGQKVGNRWYINPVSAELFFNEVKNRKKERSEKIRHERKIELKQHTRVEQKKYVRAALAETLVIVVIGFSLGMSGYLGTVSQIAAVKSAEYGFFENLAVLVFEFFSPSSTIVWEREFTTVARGTANDSVAPGEPVVGIEVESITHTSLVVAPEEIFTETKVESVRSAFSDEVQVSVDPDNPDTGVITPIFKEREGEPYRFLMVPIPSAEAAEKI